MIFHPSGGERTTDLIINNYPTTQFHANSEDSGQQQEVDNLSAWINQPKDWTCLLKHQFAGPESLKMNKIPHGELSLGNEIWFHNKTEPATFSNPFIDSDSNQDLRNNNNVNLKSHLLNFSMKNSGYFHEEDEKENLAWIPFSNLMMARNKSPSEDIQSSNLLNMCRQGEEEENQKQFVSDSSSLDQYIQWKSKLSQWDNKINPSQIEDKISSELLSTQQQQLQQQQCALELELLEKLEPIEDPYYYDDDADNNNDDEDTNVGADDDDDHEDVDGELNPNNSDLVTFLSKFPAIAAIWGQENVNETTVNGNPWNNEQNKRAFNRNFPSTSIFDFQHIEDENMEQGRNDISSSAARKFNIMNAAAQPPGNEYFIFHGQGDQDNTSNKYNLGLLNHSEKSGFIKFIPLYSDQNQSSKFKSLKYNNNNNNNQEGGNGDGGERKESSLKDMLNNLELDGCDAEEQEIVAACSQPSKTLGEESTDDDLLTSWKTHFRPVGALETQNELEVTSPTSTLSHSQLPEFRTDYNENEYVLYRGSSAFQIRFKLCCDNEKGNQTEEELTNTATSNTSFNSDFQLSSVHTPLITDYGNQFYDWLSGPFEIEEEPKDVWSDGQFDSSSSCVVHDLCCEEVYDEYEKLNNEKDSDYGQFQSFCFPGGSSNGNISNNNNKQSKASRRRAKGRPCKFFFMDGKCLRGKECKFSHDLITCRFWAEGSCLKGQTCPFLHCYVSTDKAAFESDFENHNELNTNYQPFFLESETDFPALGSTKISSRVPIISEDGSNISDDDGNTSMITNSNNNKRSDDEEEEAGYSQKNHLMIGSH